MMQSLALPAVAFLLAAAAPAVADDGRPVPYANDAGIRLAVEGEGGSGAQPDRRLAEEIGRMETSLGAALPGAGPQTETVGEHRLAAMFRRFENDPGTVHVLLTTDADGMICHVTAPVTQQMEAALPAAIQACGGELSRKIATPTGQPSNAEQTVSAAPRPAPFTDNWSKVDDVFFRVTSRFGVGGMVVIDYEPVILFKDGTSYEVGDVALEDVDLAAARGSKSKLFGRWSRSTDAYTLTAADGKVHRYALQDGSFFEAFPADQETALLTRYKRVSGGGNTALGGETMIASSNTYSFSPDGRFRIEGSVGASTAGDQSGISTTLQGKSSMAVSGRFTLEHHTLTLIYADGHQERHFFAFASKNNPPVPDAHMIFIGDSTYISED
ncbi:MAG TPA: hypothetical protein VFE34_09910 [Dongiaceae bacterium]|nr:hypothetical protein [Dongiaceae bacterium]